MIHNEYIASLQGFGPTSCVSRYSKAYSTSSPHSCPNPFALIYSEMSLDSTITFALVPKGSRFMSPSPEDGQPAVEEIVEDPVVLRIPKSRLGALCLHPVKYLKFLAWTILMLHGTIQLADSAEDLPDELPLDSLLSTAEYIFIPSPPSTCEHSPSLHAVQSTHRFS